MILRCFKFHKVEEEERQQRTVNISRGVQFQGSFYLKCEFSLNYTSLLLPFCQENWQEKVACRREEGYFF